MREPGSTISSSSSRALWQSGKAVWSDGAAAERLARAGRPIGAGHAIPARRVRLPVVSEADHRRAEFSPAARARSPTSACSRPLASSAASSASSCSRKRAEESLRESETRFRSLTQLSSDFFWETDPQHRVSSIVHGPTLSRRPRRLRRSRQDAVGAPPRASPDEAGWAVHRRRSRSGCRSATSSSPARATARRATSP